MNSRRLVSLVILSIFLMSSAMAENPPVLELNQISIPQLRVTLRGFPGDWRTDTDMSKGVPAPATEKPLPPGALRIDLPPCVKLAAMGKQTVGDAIASRRSVRSFSADPFRLDELAYLLWATQGITQSTRDEAGNPLQFRAAPSGGGRYPLETYVAVRNVEGLKPGVYRYLPLSHRLVAIREAPEIAQELQQACYGQALSAEAAFTFIWAAIPYRTEWKYGFIAHRMIAIEAGHVCENLYLAAGSIQAGTCALLSYHQPALDALIGVDGKDEFAIYMACVGKPKAH